MSSQNLDRGPTTKVQVPTNSKVPKRRVVPEIPERLAKLQQELIATEVAVIVARRNRNVEVAKLRDEAKMSQYRIAKWLGVTERAVMLMAKQGRENPQD